MGVTCPPIIKPIGWTYAISLKSIGEAPSSAGPLPWQAADPRVPEEACRLLRSQFVAVAVWHVGSPGGEDVCSDGSAISTADAGGAARRSPPESRVSINPMPATTANAMHAPVRTT